MRYHHDAVEAHIGRASHPLYSRFTLFELDDKRGLAVVQLRFNEYQKSAFWAPVDTALSCSICTNDNLKDYLEEHAGEPDQNGVYPTVDVRKLMWAIKMKPLPKNAWEKGF